MSNLENLLRRQYEGALTPEEQSELDRLTHRDQVIEAANRRAKVLRRRQFAGAMGVVSVLLVAGTIFFVRPLVGQSNSTMPVVAKADVPKADASVLEEPETFTTSQQDELSEATSVDVVSVTQRPSAKTAVSRQDSSPVATPKQVYASQDELADELQPSAILDCEPVVACNTACSPDSVINDIWKFLRT